MAVVLLDREPFTAMAETAPRMMTPTISRAWTPLFPIPALILHSAEITPNGPGAVRQYD